MNKCVRCGNDTRLYVKGQPLCPACDALSRDARSDRYFSSLGSSGPRHQCLIYEGSPAGHLPGMASLIARKLKTNIRCLYLNSPAMVVSLRKHLESAGVEVLSEVARGALMLSSEQSLGADGTFDSHRMLDSLATAVYAASSDGYDGLWATGDMSWELGRTENISRLLEYECGLENLFQQLPGLSGVCQYHRDTLPAYAIDDALHTHRALYLTETLARLNPYFAPLEASSRMKMSPAELEDVLVGLLRQPAN